MSPEPWGPGQTTESKSSFLSISHRHHDTRIYTRPVNVNRDPDRELSVDQKRDHPNGGRQHCEVQRLWHWQKPFHVSTGICFFAQVPLWPLPPPSQETTLSPPLPRPQLPFLKNRETRVWVSEPPPRVDVL